MASIYDNFDSAYQKYRNRQRLTGGTVDPSVVGALAEADLNARYNNLNTKRAQEIQQDSINKNYEIAKSNQALNTYLSKKQMDAQKTSGLYGALASLPTIALTGYKLGQEAGLWGEKKPSALEEAQTNILNSILGQMGNNQPSLYSPEFYNWQNMMTYDYPSGITGGGIYDSLGNDISMSLGDQVGDVSGSDNSWMNDLLKWIWG